MCLSLSLDLTLQLFHISGTQANTWVSWGHMYPKAWTSSSSRRLFMTLSVPTRTRTSTLRTWGSSANRNMTASLTRPFFRALLDRAGSSYTSSFSWNNLNSSDRNTTIGTHQIMSSAKRGLGMKSTSHILLTDFLILGGMCVLSPPNHCQEVSICPIYFELTDQYWYYQSVYTCFSVLLLFPLPSCPLFIVLLSFFLKFSNSCYIIPIVLICCALILVSCPIFYLSLYPRFGKRW